MSDILNSIDNLPDISFIDNLTLENIQNQILNDFVTKYQEITGEKIQLSKADPNRIIMLSCAQLIYQGLQNVDKGAKMNLLKYAFGEYLDNLVSFKRVTRNPAKYARVPIKFMLSGKREAATSIPMGTKVTSAHEIYFSTIHYAEIPAGEIEVIVMAECTQPGIIGNNYAIGELDTLVDPIGFIVKVENTEKSSGGAEIEDDQHLAERAYLAPSSYSVAGPDDAYEYWVKASNPDIGDVKITNPAPGIVDIRFVMADGSVPDDAVITATLDAVDQRNKRPLTDNVQVGKPDVENYNIDVTYFINTSDSTAATAIQDQVILAIKEYKLWQDSKIGRDINPDDLITCINNAGAKRIIVRSPVFKVINPTTKAQCIGINVIYGGLEDD